MESGRIKGVPQHYRRQETVPKSCLLESFAMGCESTQLKSREKQTPTFLVTAYFLQHGLGDRIKPGLRRLGSTCYSTIYSQCDLGWITYSPCACFIIYKKQNHSVHRSGWWGQTKKIGRSTLKTAATPTLMLFVADGELPLRCLFSSANTHPVSTGHATSQGRNLTVTSVTSQPVLIQPSTIGGGEGRVINYCYF